MHPTVDPAGAEPRRDHRSLARVSRHEVPKTAGKRTLIKIYDPARVSHIPVSQSVRRHGGRDCLLCPVHGSSGLRPSTRGYGAGTRKGCFVPHSSLLDEWLRCLSNASPLLDLLREKSVPKVASSETDIDIIGQYC